LCSVARLNESNQNKISNKYYTQRRKIAARSIFNTGSSPQLQSCEMALKESAAADFQSTFYTATESAHSFIYLSHCICFLWRKIEIQSWQEQL